MSEKLHPLERHSIEPFELLEKVVKNIMTAYVEKHTPSSFLLAYSGGLDSSVLLYILSKMRSEFPTIEIAAIHIHHGLQKQADQWVDHCRAQCAQLSMPLIVKRVDASKSKSESPEAAARDARYSAIGVEMKERDFLLLAQHRDDQSETFLLQLMRGAGPKGLAAMAEFSRWGNAFKLHPLLGISRVDLESYAKSNGLAWVEDPSNQSMDFDRNYLRKNVLPSLKARWKSADQVIARSAALCAETDLLLEEMAESDLHDMVQKDGSLDIERLLGLSQARRKNLVRYWLNSLGMDVPGYQSLKRIDNEVLFARDDAEPCVAWRQFEVRRYRNRLYALNAVSVLPSLDVPWDISRKLPIPGLGVLVTETEVGPGLSPDKLNSEVRVLFRQGGEEIRPLGDPHTRSVQKLMQREGIPPWLRARIPLVFVGNELVAVVGYWYAEAYRAVQNEQSVQIRLISEFS